MKSRPRFSGEPLSIWPGYVDVLSALLMVVIFVLLLFTLSQFILGHLLSDQSTELESLHERLDEISQLLGLEEEKNRELTTRISALTGTIETLTIDRAALESDIEGLTAKTLADQDAIDLHLRTIASLQQDIAALQTVRNGLETRIGTLLKDLDASSSRNRTLRDRSKALEARLADEQELTALAQRELEHQNIRIQALAALVDEQQQAMDDQETLTAEARAEVTLLNRQVGRLREQLAEISRALARSESERKAQENRAEDLGKRLNIELARRVNDLERYRSEFFGRLRDAIGENPQVRIEGDRFLLQAELLFPSGSAELELQGKEQLEQLAAILNELITAIPPDLQWILRVDGHTDRVPIRSSEFASNWELSTARAVSVVRFLAGQGIPEERMAAAGFSKFHPIDTAESPAAYRRNRRIEIKLTSR